MIKGAVMRFSHGKKRYTDDSGGQPLQIIHVDGQLYMFDIDPDTKDIWGYDGDYVLHHYKY